MPKSFGKNLCAGSGGYLRLHWCYQGKVWVYVEHRLVWEQHHGELPDGWIVHHLNGDRIDNRIENLHAMPADEHLALHDFKKPSNETDRLITCFRCRKPRPVKYFYDSTGFNAYLPCQPCRAILNQNLTRTRLKTWDEMPCIDSAEPADDN